MDYRNSNFDDFSNSTYSSLQSTAPNLFRTPKTAWFRLCITYRNRNNTKYVDIFEDRTLEDLKWEIYKQLNLRTKPTDFSLTVFDETDYMWLPLHNKNAYTTIFNLNLPLHSFLNIEKHEEINTRQQHRSTVREVELTLRLCKRPMDKSEFVNLTAHESTTLGRLKEQAQKEVTNQRTHHLLLWTKDEWKKFETTHNDLRLIELGFVQYSIISFEAKNEPKRELALKLCKRPMDKSEFVNLTAHESTTLGQLKEQAQKEVMDQRTHIISLWTKDGWTKFETALDDLTLAELDFTQYSIISFETKDDPIPGVCGLTNLGNTCFMNSALQCLSNIPEFTRNILSFNDEMNAPIVGAYSALIKTIWSGKNAFTTPSSLLLNIRENLPRFTRYRQQDAQEFMNYFLHLIHQEFTNERTLITDLFYGRIQSSVKCLGGCHLVETNEEVISFLPLPIENDINQYEILYLRSNGEQRLVSVRVCAKTIDTLIKSFIDQNEPKLSAKQIKAVRIVDNSISDEYPHYEWLSDTTKHQLAFIEVPKKTVEQDYIEFQFLNSETRKPFRSPLFLVRPSYSCRYSDLSEQINQIQNHLCSVTNAPTSACYLCWINNRSETYYINSRMNRDDTMLFMDRLVIEMDPEWVEKYRHQYNFERLQSNASLNNLLTDFFREEPLNGDYYCSKCLGLKKARQKADFALPLPRVLIIQLKRFTYDTYSDAKIDTYIHFPLKDLDLSQYVIQNDKKNTNIPALYDLVAVSNHTGTLVSGHYTTYARNDRNKTWYSFNDEITREIRDEKDIVTKNAYILVYIKRTVQ